VLQTALFQAINLHSCSPELVSAPGFSGVSHDFVAVDTANVVKPRLYARIGSRRIGKNTENMVSYFSAGNPDALFTPVVLFCCRRLFIPHGECDVAQGIRLVLLDRDRATAEM
jgi:hypothetical protein